MKEDLYKLLTMRGESSDTIEKYITDLTHKYESYAKPLKESVFLADNGDVRIAETTDHRKLVEVVLLSLLLTSINTDNSFDRPNVTNKVQHVCDSLGIKYEDVLFALRHETEIRSVLDFAS
jgi:hypothetical protein